MIYSHSMKITPLVLLIICSYCAAQAQSKNNLYTDLAINSLGTSVTYDRRIAKHFDLGIGISLNDINGDKYYNRKMAAFIDLRPYRVIRRNMFFALFDIGFAFYGGRIPAPGTTSLGPYNPYVGLGVGYGYRINKRGMGPYISLCADGFVQNQINQNLALPHEARNNFVIDETLVISLGFKF